MAEKNVNLIRQKVEELKKSMNPKALFVITSDDKILYASAPLIQMLKSDPAGTSFVPLVLLGERQALRDSLENVESGEFMRTFQLGTQQLSVQMTTLRNVIDGRIIGLTIVNKIKILTTT
jgi:hypothetical protein